MRFHDGLIGLVVILLGVGMIVLASDLPNTQALHLRYGPGFFPTVVAVGLIGAGATLVVQSVLAPRHPWVMWADWAGSPDLRVNAASVLASVVVYILAAEDLGFLVVAPVLLFGLIYRLRRNLREAMAIAVFGSFAIHQFFVVILLVPLPWGVVPYFKLF
jgi:putative tricarboxylic transport membrane protein